MNKVERIVGMAAVFVIGALGTACGESDQSARDGSSAHARTLPSQLAPGEQLVFRRVREVDNIGNVLNTSITGSLTVEQWRRAAQGSRFNGEEEDWLYSERATTVPTGPDTTLSLYEIVRKERVGVSAAVVSPPLQIGSKVQNAISNGTPDRLTVDIGLRDVPAWDIPLVPPSALFPPAAITAARQEKIAARAARKQAIDMLAASLTTWLTSVGADVHSTSWVDGSVYATVPVSALHDLVGRDDVQTLYVLREGSNDCDLSCPLANASEWKLGDAHQDVHADSGRFLDEFYDGELTNPDRHGWNDITMAIIEGKNDGTSTYGRFEDEACLFGDLSEECTASSRRIKDRFLCDGGNPGSCSSVSNFADNSDNAVHGTLVTSIAIGDLADNQAKNKSYGDSCWSSGDGTYHCSAWKDAASGMAPEAGLLYYATKGNDSRHPAYDDLVTEDPPDVVNMSLSTVNNDCDIASQRTAENKLESAFDDGALVVTSSGNTGAGSGCNLNSPGDTPKIFTVGSVMVENCYQDYDNCPLDTNETEEGGMDAVVAGTTRSGEVSGIDLIAPSGIVYRGSHQGGWGKVLENAETEGSSVAAPHVAGSAILVKDWMLDSGNSWINNPGRLHTMMLAMGDRHGPVGRRTNGDNDDTDTWGFGRLKLRLLENGQGFGPWGWSMRTDTHTTTSGDVSYMVWSSPFPSGTELVKCVVNEDEDMSSKTDVGDIYLRMRIRDAVSGSCSSSGTLRLTASDASWDLKHFTAVEDASTNIEGKCAEVELNVQHVAGSSIDTHVFCYYAGKLDDQPN